MNNELQWIMRSQNHHPACCDCDCPPSEFLQHPQGCSPLVNNYQKWKYNFKPLLMQQGAMPLVSNKQSISGSYLSTFVKGSPPWNGSNYVMNGGIPMPSKRGCGGQEVPDDGLLSGSTGPEDGSRLLQTSKRPLLDRDIGLVQLSGGGGWWWWWCMSEH